MNIGARRQPDLVRTNPPPQLTATVAAAAPGLPSVSSSGVTSTAVSAATLAMCNSFSCGSRLAGPLPLPLERLQGLAVSPHRLAAVRSPDEILRVQQHGGHGRAVVSVLPGDEP